MLIVAAAGRESRRVTCLPVFSSRPLSFTLRPSSSTVTHSIGEEDGTIAECHSAKTRPSRRWREVRRRSAGSCGARAYLPRSSRRTLGDTERGASCLTLFPEAKMCVRRPHVDHSVPIVGYWDAPGCTPKSTTVFDRCRREVFGTAADRHRRGSGRVRFRAWTSRVASGCPAPRPARTPRRGEPSRSARRFDERERRAGTPTLPSLDTTGSLGRQRPRGPPYLGAELGEREHASTGERGAVAARRDAAVDEAQPAEDAHVTQAARGAARAAGEARPARTSHATTRAGPTVAARSAAPARQSEAESSAHGSGHHIHAAFHEQVARETFQRPARARARVRCTVVRGTFVATAI